MQSFKKDMIFFINHLKNTGFVYPGSEIYGGLSNTWDYGDLGIRLKNNVKKMWFNYFLNSELDIYGLDSSIILKSDVWKASGHVESFEDFLVECKNCHKRMKVEDIFGDLTDNNHENKLSNESCPFCKKKTWTEPKNFNLMFKISYGKTKEKEFYLRPETAQGIFLNFLNTVQSNRATLPFGVGQIGKSFRNEVTASNFIFRTKEFEQMEIEWFCLPEDAIKYFDYFLDKMLSFFNILGIDKKNISFHDQNKSELAHYSVKTTDIMYKYPFGIKELAGISNRTDYDLKNHSEKSGIDLKTTISNKNLTKIFPFVIEPSFGLERTILSILWDNLKIEILPNKTERIVLELKNNLAPYICAVLPLSKKLAENTKKKIFENLLFFPITYDQNGSIGKRYRRQDAIGTPFCITYDFQSENDDTVTIRERDSMKQKRIPISEIRTILLNATLDNE